MKIKLLIIIIIILLILINLLIKLKEKYNDIKPNNICFISGFIGIKTKNIPLPKKNNDCYFLSNNNTLLKKAKKKGWIPIYIDIKLTNNLRSNSKKSKILRVKPHIFIKKKYDYYVWFDNNWELKYNKIIKIIKKWDNKYIVGAGPNFLGIKTIKQEIKESLKRPRYYKDVGKWYKYLNLPEHKNLEYNGYYQTGNLIWNMKNKLTKDFQEEWLKHIDIVGIHCQISFNILIRYLKWRDKIKNIGMLLYNANY